MILRTLVKSVQHKILNFFLPIIFKICIGCSKEPSLETVLLSPTTFVLVEK